MSIDKAMFIVVTCTYTPKTAAFTNVYDFHYNSPTHLSSFERCRKEYFDLLFAGLFSIDLP